MNNKIKLSMVAGAFLVSSSLFVGCGSDSSSITALTGVGGSASKGHLSGASVWLDLNNDGVHDAGETTTTDANGKYSFSSSPAGTPIMVVTGGIDTGSGDAFEGELKAPYSAGDSVVNLTPITSMVSALIEQGVTPASAKTKTANALGLSEDDLNVDPVSNLLKADGNSSIARASLKLARLVEFIASKSGGVAANYASVMSSIAADIDSNSSAKLDSAASKVASDKGLSSADQTASAKIGIAIDDMNLTAGISVTALKAAETATKLVVKILESNSSAVVGVDNLGEVVKALIEQADTNGSATINLDTLVSTLPSDTNASDFNLSATIANANSSLVDEESYLTSEQDAANTAITNAAIAVDKLKLKDNKIIVGGTTASLSSIGSFGDITHEVIQGNIGTLYDFSFTLENLTDENGNSYNSLENGDDKNVTIALKIVGEGKKLLAVIDHVSLTRGTADGNYTGEYSVGVTSDTKLSAWAIKSDNQAVSTTNVTLTTDAITSSGSAVTASVSKIITQLENDSTFGSSVTSIKYALSQNGSYAVSVYISGVDGVSNTKLSSSTDVADGFNTSSENTIKSKFSGTVSKMYGTVSIGLTVAEVLAKNQTAVTTAKNNLTISELTDLTSGLTLPQPTEGTTILWATSNPDVIAENGSITRTETAGSATLTATITKGNGETQATATKTFSVSVAANPVNAINSSVTVSASSTNFGGSAVTVTAEARNETNSTVSGKSVSFSAATLGDLNTTTCTTGSSGSCSITYTPKSSGPDGSDTISATVSSNGNTVSLGSVVISVVNDPLAAYDSNVTDTTSVQSTDVSGVNITTLANEVTIHFSAKSDGGTTLDQGKIQYLSIGGIVVASISYVPSSNSGANTMYEGSSFIVVYGGTNYSGTFTESTYSSPTILAAN